MPRGVTPDLLKGCPLFPGLEAGDLRELAALAQVARAGKGDTLFREGEPAEGFFLLVEGRVKLTKIGAGGREQILHSNKIEELTLLDATARMSSFTLNV